MALPLEYMSETAAGLRRFHAELDRFLTRQRAIRYRDMREVSLGFWVHKDLTPEQAIDFFGRLVNG